MVYECNAVSCKLENHTSDLFDDMKDSKIECKLHSRLSKTYRSPAPIEVISNNATEVVVALNTRSAGLAREHHRA